MNRQWYYLTNGERKGPFDASVLKSLVKAGTIVPTTPVWTEGLSGWKEARLIKGLMPLPTPVSVSIPPSSHGPPPAPGAPAAGLQDACSFRSQMTQGGKYVGVLGVFAGLAGDVLQPLAPINGYVFVVTAILATLFTAQWLRQPVAERRRWEKRIPQQALICCLAILLAFGFWSLGEMLAGSDDRGLLASQFGVVRQLQDQIFRIEKDLQDIKNSTTAIKADTTALLDSATNISTRVQEIVSSTDASRDASTQTLSAVQGLNAQVEDVRASIRKAIGSKNLGAEYDCTQSHRQYQIEMLESETNREARLLSLVTEYQKLASSQPGNAMYRYLLARLYDISQKPDLALAEAKAGLLADSSYMWNRRFLLYIDTTQPIDLDKRLEMERIHYSLTPNEIQMFASGDLASAARAYEELKLRFRADAIISEDLDKLFCWHLFKTLSASAYDQGKAFSNLVGKECVSGRNLIRLRITDVKAGADALSLVGRAPVGIVTYEERQERIGQSTLVRDIQSRHTTELSAQQQLVHSLRAPPIALRLSVMPQDSAVATDSMSDMRFGLGGILARKPSPELRRVFGELPEFEVGELQGVPTDEIDVPGQIKTADFWVYFFGAPLPWMTSADSEFELKFCVNIGQKAVRIADSVTVTAAPSKDSPSPRVDAVKVLGVYEAVRRMKNAEARGQKLSAMMEAKVYINFSDDHIKAYLFGREDFALDVVFGPRVNRMSKTLAELGLQWPTVDVREEFGRLAEGEWFRFTGTVLKNEAGVLTVVPDAVEIVE